MTVRPLVLSVLALALLAAVVWDNLARLGQKPAAPSAPAAQGAAPVPRLNPMSQRPAAEFAALFDRPLFDPSRQRAVLQDLPPDLPAPQAAPLPQVAAPTAAHPVLMGTVTSPWPGGAYLGDDQGGPVVFLRPGEAAQGLSLEEARPDSALFQGPDGEVILTLQPAPTDGPGPSATPQAAPPNTADPNATDLGAMAPGAVDPTAGGDAP